jgi:hypothetical protein
MRKRRMAWATCIVAVIALGLSGILAQGCDATDTPAPWVCCDG